MNDIIAMSLAQNYSICSDDPNHKVGACIINNGKIISCGYNHILKNLSKFLVVNNTDLTLPKLQQKYTYICHAEVDAICKNTYNNSMFDGATLYVTLFPCNECAKMIIQLGIKEVVYLEDYIDEIENISKYLFDNCGVKYRKMEITNEN